MNKTKQINKTKNKSKNTKHKTKQNKNKKHNSTFHSGRVVVKIRIVPISTVQVQPTLKWKWNTKDTKNKAFVYVFVCLFCYWQVFYWWSKVCLLFSLVLFVYFLKLPPMPVLEIEMHFRDYHLVHWENNVLHWTVSPEL